MGYSRIFVGHGCNLLRCRDACVLGCDQRAIQQRSDAEYGFRWLSCEGSRWRRLLVLSFVCPIVGATETEQRGGAMLVDVSRVMEPVVLFLQLEAYRCKAKVLAVV